MRVIEVLPLGRLITLEGSEGSGKSTNIHFLHQLLIGRGIDVVLTREPGGTALGERIRELLLGHHGAPIGIDAELLLMYAARAQHMHDVIQPSLAAGRWVLCDRFIDASYAYQGGGRGVDSQRIDQLDRWLLGTFRPHLTFYLDIPVQQGLERAGRRGELDRFEQEESLFFERVRAAYQLRAQQESHRFRVIDASVELERVQQQIQLELDKFLDEMA